MHHFVSIVLAQGTWYEDGGQPRATNINSRFVTLYFADMDAGEDALRGIMPGSKLPYTLAIPTNNETFLLAHSHMVSECVGGYYVCGRDIWRERKRTAG